MPKDGKAPKKNAAGYKMAPPIPKGEILEDISKKKWIIGESIGKGGFGEIYSAQPYDGTKKGVKDNYVIKIVSIKKIQGYFIVFYFKRFILQEPHANGPLFVEMHFYMRNAKSEDGTFIQGLLQIIKVLT